MGSFGQEWQHGDRGHKGWTNRNAALRIAAKRSFYNTSKFTLRDLRSIVSK